MTEAGKLFELLNDGISPAHAVSACEKRLTEAGFELLDYGTEWKLVPGHRYVINHHETPLFAFSVSGCIGLALMVAMGISSFMGTTIPISLKKLGMDPAVASGPLITTMNDLAAVITYYGMAWLLLINTLHLAG